jgi:anti-anti-sigma factor
VVTLLFLTGLFEKLPEATLAAVVIAALVELVDVRSLIRFYRLYTAGLGHIYGFAARPDFIAAIAAMLGVLIFDTLPGLFIGILVSAVLLLYRASRPNVAVLGHVPGTKSQWSDLARHPENEPEPGIVVLRPESGLFFANADEVRDRVRREAQREGTRAIVLDAETMPYIDMTAANMLAELQRDLERADVTLVLARDIGQVRDVLRTASEDGAGPAAYPTIQEAVDALRRSPGTPR